MKKTNKIRKKGFTLIELLAAIIVIAIIALITSPIILRSINNAKISTNKSSVLSISKAAEEYYAKKIFSDEEIDPTKNIYSELEFKGKKPTKAEVVVNNNSEVEIAVVYDDKCYSKKFNESIVSITEDPDNCNVDIELAKEYDYRGPIVALQKQSTENEGKIDLMLFRKEQKESEEETWYDMESYYKGEGYSNLLNPESGEIFNLYYDKDESDTCLIFHLVLAKLAI